MYGKIISRSLSRKIASKLFHADSILYATKRCLSEVTSEKSKNGEFHLTKALIVRKVTRYEYEKYILKPDLTEDQLKSYINKKGSNYNFLLLRHEEYVRSLMELENAFEKRNIKYRLVHRYNFKPNLIDWADAIFSSGGDGTFLLAASKVQVSDMPVIGINSDPGRSEGFLCLQKKYSLNLNLLLDKLVNNEFMWYWRQRIRLTMYGSYDPPFDLYDHQVLQPENRFFEKKVTGPVPDVPDGENVPLEPRVLPILSLNEVFIGEKLSARVSFYEISIDGSHKEKQKSSGIMVCPGTGSTSWYFNSNNITDTTVREILRIAQKYHCCTDADVSGGTKLKDIVNEFNRALVFDPTEPKMAYSVRDPLAAGVFHVSSEPRGFCKNLKVKSRMWDACVVIDGSLSYAFNDGAELDLSMHAEDALKCIKILPGPGDP